MVTADQIVAAHQENPTWSASQIAAHLDCAPCHVRVVAKRKRLNLTRQTPKRKVPGTIIQLGRACRKANLSVRDIERISQEQPAGG